MTMYINPFIAGVLCTLAVELLALVLAAIVQSGRRDK